jgi:amino acid transporter
MAATHAAEMKNPRKDYPKAMLFSVIIILASIMLSSLDTQMKNHLRVLVFVP